MSLWTDSGAFVQSPYTESEEEQMDPPPNVAEVCYFDHICGCHPDCGSSARILQVHLSGRNAGGWHPPAHSERGVASLYGLALFLEKSGAGAVRGRGCFLLSVLLPVSVSPRCVLLPVQPDRRGSALCGRTQVQRLRSLRNTVQDGCQMRGRPGVHFLYGLQAALSHESYYSVYHFSTKIKRENKFVRYIKKKALHIICFIMLALFLLTACGQQWTCDNCEKQFQGTAYVGYYGTETLCEDCARTYWAPFSYKDFKK